MKPFSGCRKSFEDFQEGQTLTAEYVVTQGVYDAFMAAFNDTSPIHVDESFAKKHGFDGRVMHGGIVNGFISHFIGTAALGEHALLQSVNVQFKSPVYLGNRLRFDARVEQVTDSVKALVLSIKIMNLDKNTTAAVAKVQAGMRQ